MPKDESARANRGHAQTTDALYNRLGHRAGFGAGLPTDARNMRAAGVAKTEEREAEEAQRRSQPFDIPFASIAEATIGNKNVSKLPPKAKEARETVEKHLRDLDLHLGTMDDVSRLLAKDGGSRSLVSRVSILVRRVSGRPSGWKRQDYGSAALRNCGQLLVDLPDDVKQRLKGSRLFSSFVVGDHLRCLEEMYSPPDVPELYSHKTLMKLVHLATDVIVLGDAGGPGLDALSVSIGPGPGRIQPESSLHFQQLQATFAGAEWTTIKASDMINLCRATSGYLLAQRKVILCDLVLRARELDGRLPSRTSRLVKEYLDNPKPEVLDGLVKDLVKAAKLAKSDLDTTDLDGDDARADESETAGDAQADGMTALEDLLSILHIEDHLELRVELQDRVGSRNPKMDELRLVMEGLSVNGRRWVCRLVRESEGRYLAIASQLLRQGDEQTGLRRVMWVKGRKEDNAWSALQKMYYFALAFVYSAATAKAA